MDPLSHWEPPRAGPKWVTLVCALTPSTQPRRFSEGWKNRCPRMSGCKAGADSSAGEKAKGRGVRRLGSCGCSPSPRTHSEAGSSPGQL
ncbi:hypothetical protein CapIbe_009899 [Capra ibex]